MSKRISIVKSVVGMAAVVMVVGLAGQGNPVLAADRTVIGELWSQDN